MRLNGKIKVMVFGTFDRLHKGHLNFFKQARALAESPFLIVSVARDVNVTKIKGKKPYLNERQRLNAVKKCALVDKAVLGGTTNYLPHIIREKPNIIALGYDQGNYIQNLQAKLAKSGLRVKVVRLKPYRPEIYKSSLLN